MTPAGVMSTVFYTDGDAMCAECTGHLLLSFIESPGRGNKSSNTTQAEQKPNKTATQKPHEKSRRVIQLCTCKVRRW